MRIDVINNSGNPITAFDICQVLKQAETFLSVKAIARDLDVDPQSEYLLAISDECFDMGLENKLTNTVHYGKQRRFRLI